MIYFGIKPELIDDNTISLKPVTVDIDGKIIKNSIHMKHRNKIIGSVEYLNKNRNSISIFEESYKQLIVQIHHILNNYGYQTDSSGIDKLDIRVVNDKYVSDMSFDPNKEIATGIIMNMWFLWIIKQVLGVEHKFTLDKTDTRGMIRTKGIFNLERSFSIDKNSNLIGNYTMQFGSHFADHTVDGLKYLENELKYSKYRSKKIFNNIVKSIKSTFSTKYDWDSDTHTFTCTYKSEKDMMECEKKLSDIIIPIYTSLRIRRDIIDEWFNSPFIVNTKDINTKYIDFSVKLKPQGKHMVLTFKYFSACVSFENFSRAFLGNLSKSEIESIVGKYFDYDDKNIYTNINLIDCENYILELTKIRINVVNMMHNLLELNDSKK